MPQPMDSLSSQHCVARALYDNIPDSPDELAFRKGDTLVVLEQNTANIEGWWLCSLRGRQGICPANRLRLIPGVYDDTGQTLVLSTQLSDISNDYNCFESHGKRRSWHVQPNQVVTPKKYNDIYLYDMPSSRCSPIPVSSLNLQDNQTDSYDIPRKVIPISEPRYYCTRCSPAPSCVSPINRDVSANYDVPRSLQTLTNELSPSSSASSLTADSLSSSNRSSLANMPDYDTPKSIRVSPFMQGIQNLDIVLTPPLKELPLELNSALENLEKLQCDTTSSICKLLGFVVPQWRTKKKLEGNLMEIKLAVIRLRTSLHDLAEFSEGTLGNAAKASDKNLSSKLAPLVAALKKSDSLVCEATEKLNEQKWALDLLWRSDDDERSRKPDELEQLVACSRALTEDIRQISSFIQGNGLLLFKKEQSVNIECPDYDYISFESKESVLKTRAEVRELLPNQLKQTYDNLVKHADDIAFDNDPKAGLDTEDRQVLNFFAAQLITHHKNLTQAIDAFLQTVERNQPPKVFLAHGKFVVLSAHKLVHIGDTVYRNISCPQYKEKALNYSNALSDALATSVNKTKQAALQFPNVIAVQEMVDSIVDISYSARDLKVCIVQAANVI